MREARAGCAAVVGPDHRIYVVGGGGDGRSCHTSIEVLDVREKVWDRHAQPAWPRRDRDGGSYTSMEGAAPCRYGRHYNAVGVGADGNVYVAGAFRHAGYLDVVHKDPCGEFHRPF